MQAFKHCLLKKWHVNVLQYAIILLLFLQLSLSNAADSPLIFKPEGTGKYSLNANIEYLDDPNGEFTVDEVANEKTASFKLLDETKPLGYEFKHKALWLRFAVDFSQYKDPYWFLINDYEHIGNFKVFFETNVGFQQSEMDENLPQEGRYFNVREYIYKIPTPQTTTSYFYIRVAPHSRFLRIDLSWAGIKGSIESAHNAQFSYGLFFGGLLVLWLYNFALYISLRDKSYLYYIYYLGCFTGVFFHIYGFAPYLFRLTPFWEAFFAALGYGAIHGMVLFARQFLALKTTLKWVDRYLQVFQWLLFAGGVAAFFQPVGLPFKYLNVLILLVIPVIIFAGMRRWINGYMPAQIYSYGWIIFAVALGLLSLRSIGILPANFITNNAVMVASVWEAVMFALALSYRMKLVEKESARAKTTFLGMISHELKTPLQGICSAIDLLSMKMPQNDVILQRLRTSTEHLEIQVRDLTDYARLEDGKLRFQSRSFDASQLAHKVVEEFRPSAETKGLELQTDIEDGILISSDAVRMEQILNNLISNAIKYTKTGYVLVRVRQEGLIPPKLVFSVSDSGIGFDLKNKKTIFDPFTQIDQTSTRKHDGIGMGLAIVKQLVDLFGGTINVDSEPNKGSNFTVVLPVDKHSGTIIDTYEDETEAEEIILLVDDNQQVRETLKNVVEQLGYRCHSAEGGKAALELVKAKKYTAILLDVNMPDIDGFEVASSIRGSVGCNRSTPIIWISATPPEIITAEQKRLFTHFLEKPVRSQQLGNMLKKIIS